VRRMDLPAARKLLGAAIGMCPKGKLFKGYIQLEVDLREFDRVRTLYEKYIESDPTNSSAWIQFAQFEAALADNARSRAIFELGVQQSLLTYPENLWKSYIDFEFEQGERERVRDLYERLVSVSGHWKAWVAFAEFEGSAIPMTPAAREEQFGEDDEEERYVDGDVEVARRTFEKGYKDQKDKGLKQERVYLLEAWKAFEQKHASDEDVQKVQKLFPIVAKKRRVVDEVEEEYWDMAFPDDEREANPASFKFLEMAHKWKRAQAAGDGGTSVLSGLQVSGAGRSSTEVSSEPRQQAKNDEGSDEGSSEED